MKTSDWDSAPTGEKDDRYRHPLYILEYRSVQEIKKMNYRYGMRLRGFSIGCQPMNGFYERRDSRSIWYHDILLYTRKLTDEEVEQYELDYIGSEEQ